MARILSNEELKHLTIPRLQNLLKAARARAHAVEAGLYCECCGELLSELWGDNHQSHEYSNQLNDYVYRVKLRLNELQSSVQRVGA